MPSQIPEESFQQSVMPRFDDDWPELETRLRRSLTARRVPAQDRDDVIQETALRVYRVWDSLDPTRSAWPFVITVAVNFWRDIVRERTGRIAVVHPSASIEVTDHQDVERDVLARQELASVRIAWRALGPEQRRLLLATEEFADTVRPLRPAERVARMRVRRQLARAVGRASALVPVLFLRRPGRTTSAVAAAYASAMAATVFTAPAMVNTPVVTAMPRPAYSHSAGTPARHVTGPTAHQKMRTAAQDSSSAAPTAASVAHVDAPGVSVLRTAPRPTPAHVCSPVQLPASLVRVAVSVGSTTIYGPDATGSPEAIAATPSLVAKAYRGCVGVEPSK
jgi:DNA-directed RNA polymerase specialized sigma24 family protein